MKTCHASRAHPIIPKGVTFDRWPFSPATARDGDESETCERSRRKSMHDRATSP
jgi:hypothetical protein